MESSTRRIVITGMGMVTPLGHDTATTWAAILRGESGFGPLTLLEEKDDHTSLGACEVKGFDGADYLGRRDARRRDRVQQLATVAAREAMEQSGLTVTDANREDIGIYFGTGIGGVRTLIDMEHVRLDKGVGRLSPLSTTMIMPNGAGGMIGIDYGVTGPNTTITTACASGCDALGYALRAIRSGEIDAAIAGGAESIMTSVCVAGFEAARSTSRRDALTPSPFDLDRDGLVVGEGAGVLILESEAHARARGAVIYGELAGYGQTSDAYHITAPPPDGSGAARAITRALRDAGVNADALSYVNAHGTGTQLNDSAETAAIKSVLGDHAYRIPVSSTKSMTGHIMGGTGAIEAMFCALAIRDQVAPPTINYRTPDPECDLDYVPNEARHAPIDICLNNAFGFGGHNGVLVIRAYRG